MKKQKNLEDRAEILEQLKKMTPEEVAGVIQTLEKKCVTATIQKHSESVPVGHNYALFVWHTPAPRIDMRGLMHACMAGDDLREFKATQESPQQLLFLKLSKDPKELMTIIQSQPMLKYVILKGDMMNITSNTQVFADGKILSTLESEWS